MVDRDVEGAGNVRDVWMSDGGRETAVKTSDN